jgi:hypothetical protein
MIVRQLKPRGLEISPAVPDFAVVHRRAPNPNSRANRRVGCPIDSGVGLKRELLTLEMGGGLTSSVQPGDQEEARGLPARMALTDTATADRIRLERSGSRQSSLREDFCRAEAQ